MMSNRLMEEYKEVFGDSIDALKFTLKICGFDLRSIRVEPEFSKGVRKFLKEKGVDVV